MHIESGRSLVTNDKDQFMPVALPSGAIPAWPQYDDRERAALGRALDQGQWWRLGGQEVELFETEFAEANGAPHALGVVNGTTALELALRIHGIGPGDEVVVPAFTFISTSLAVQNVGATPMPTDVDPHSMCMLAKDVERVLTSRTKAVIPVHMAGHVSDMKPIEALADAYGLVVIQDAAHAPLASRDGRLTGAGSSVACHSFQNGKLMTAGEGGALTLPSEELFERAYLMHTCGRPRGDVTYQHVTPGGNYRMNEFSAAILRTQLQRLRRDLPTRFERATQLNGIVDKISGISRQVVADTIDVNPYYMYLLTLDESFTRQQRDHLVDLLKKAGLAACVGFPPVYRTAAFQSGPTPDLDVDELARKCPVSEAIGARGLWLAHKTLLAEPITIELIGELLGDLVGRIRE